MKTTHLLVLSLLLATAFPARAQLQAGDAFTGGALGFDYNTEESGDLSEFSFVLSPRFGYLLTERFALGLSLSYRYSRFHDALSPDLEYTDINQVVAIAPFIRRYYPLNERFGFLFDLRLGLNFGSAESEAVRPSGATPPRLDEVSTFGFSAGLDPGLYYFFGQRFALELTVGSIAYQVLRTQEKGSNEDPVTEQTVSTAFNDKYRNFRLGFNYFFNRAR